MQWEPVEYFDNKIICDLVESKPNGIIAIMVSSLAACLTTHFNRLYVCLCVCLCVSKTTQSNPLMDVDHTS